MSIDDFGRDTNVLSGAADEKKGVTKVSIYTEMKGPVNAQVAAIQAAAKKLAQRFPLSDVPLKNCT